MSAVSPDDGAVLIGLDWGTSNLRVLRIGPNGTVLAARSDPRGAGALESEAFSRVLGEVAGAWLEEGLPVLACGMVGARGKWREMPYLAAPATLQDLAAGLASPADRADVRLVPGLKTVADGLMVDVMRGEETQVMGLDLTPGLHRIVAPGTHSKWITARPGEVLSCQTFMTGELFSAIRKGTILGAGMGEAGADAAAFAAGVRRALAEPALTATLFSVRVERLAGRLGDPAAADYLSGILIGAEVATRMDDPQGPVTLVGTTALNDRYATALRIAGFSEVRTADGAAATARGLWRIHEASRMIRTLDTLPVIAILRGLNPAEAVAVGEAIVAAGLVCLEVPLNSPRPLESIRLLRAALDGRALVGAGTVLSVEAAQAVADAGGQMIISPNTNPAVIRESRRLGLLSIPGFFTPSEAFAALDAGADALKLFPAEVAGPQGLRAVRAVLPAETRVYAVGGASPEDVPLWTSAGASGFGVGSAIFKPGFAPAEVGARARAFAEAWISATDTRPGKP
ncbi:2-dehydro-3-deoxy-6-phosphogalactonate aldolase [Brevundimonas sp. R86498]|uniref:2-dehydro-3-deoxy-6-phosphogalactonate aldolase n=1 Tax=Brevundimonas sp. R86498 TaxID=3093845 RepID=UPI0037C512FC